MTRIFCPYCGHEIPDDWDAIRHESDCPINNRSQFKEEDEFYE